MSVLCKYAIAEYFAYCHIFRIFQQNVHIAYFFCINWHFDGNFNIICVYCLFLVSFVTSTIWLPTEWHHPCVWTPVEQDGLVGLKQFCTIFPPYIWCLCGPHIFFKCCIKLTCLTACVCIDCRRLVQNCSNITELNLTGCRRITNVYVCVLCIVLSVACLILLSFITLSVLLNGLL